MRRWLIRIGLVVLLLTGGAVALDRMFPPNLARLASGVEVLDREGRTLSVLPAAGGTWRLRTTTGDVPPHLVDLLIAAEDRRFRAHPGVDPIALARASVQWIRAGHIVSGGSTLTMQAARLLEPRPRTLRSKLFEIARAIQLEWRFSKDEILGIWLTLASQGGNIEGVRAGALAWFGRPAARLEPAESALLVALARRPGALRPDRHADAARVARDGVLAFRARPHARLSAEDLALAAATPVPSQRIAMPHLAPHLAREVAAEAGPQARIRTPLDAPLQRAVEAIVAETMRTLPDRASLAIVVTELATRDVRALVGGDWMAEGRAGAIDLTRAVRSPGSALKPFLYAMAFQDGIVTPRSVVSDLPVRYGSYAPENFDRGFTGRVTAADALRMSLNIPAVALLDRVGALRFASGLKAAGTPMRLPRGADPSLPLALGGAGTTLRELTGLYATMGAGGEAVPLRLTCPLVGCPAPEAGTRVIEARAAQMVGSVLVQNFPGGGPHGIAWKTGTSWGGRDAWALGFDMRHAVGVWVGRPDATPMPGATGRSLALPVLGRVFALLPAAPREGLTVRPVASASEGQADRLRLLFPPPGAVLAEEEGAVTLRAAGGRRPLTFLVDGAPIPHEPARRETSWTPEGPGFYRVTVLDADGAAVRAEVRIRPGP